MTRLMLLCADETDMFDWLGRHPDRSPDMVVWPGRFQKLIDHRGSFDRLAVTGEASHMQAAIAACLTRVKGPDGLTVGQRLTADEIGARLRGAS